MRIYVASSWRNLLQPAIVHALRRIGHEVYDFRHPLFPKEGGEGGDGFHWSEIDPNWRDWSPAAYREALKHPIAERGYENDIQALRACEACGRSASWEFGYAMGRGKRGYVVQFEPQEPELMFREATILTSMNEIFDAFGEPEPT